MTNAPALQSPSAMVSRTLGRAARGAFTLLEMLVVIVVILILIIIAIPAFNTIIRTQE